MFHVENLSLLDAENIFQGQFPVRNETNVNSPTINDIQLAFLNYNTVTEPKSTTTKHIASHKSKAESW